MSEYGSMRHQFKTQAQSGKYRLPHVLVLAWTCLIGFEARLCTKAESRSRRLQRAAP